MWIYLEIGVATIQADARRNPKMAAHCLCTGALPLLYTYTAATAEVLTEAQQTSVGRVDVCFPSEHMNTPSGTPSSQGTQSGPRVSFILPSAVSTIGVARCMAVGAATPSCVTCVWRRGNHYDRRPSISRWPRRKTRTWQARTCMPRAGVRRAKLPQWTSAAKACGQAL